MTKPLERRCGTCKHWQARLSEKGRRIYSGDPIYRCSAPVAPLPALPASARVNDGYGSVIWPPRLEYMLAEQGTACAMWEPWK